MISSSLGSTNVLAIKQHLLARNFVGSAMLIASFFMHGCSTFPFANIYVFDGMTVVSASCMRAHVFEFCWNNVILPLLVNNICFFI